MQKSFAPDAPVPSNLTRLEEAVWRGLLAAQVLAHTTSVDYGWHSDPKTGLPKERNFGEALALMHSELSEALEADRKGKLDDKLTDRDGREVEFADCLIRIFDIAEACRMDLASAVILKNRFNKERADHKIENRLTEGGKTY